MREDAKAEVARVHALSTVMAQYFAGQEPGVIGSVLAELMSNFLVCHQIRDDPAKQTKLRDDILKEWLDTVHQLVAVHDREGTRVQ